MKRIVRHSVVLGAFAILSSLSFPAFADSSSTVELEFTFASTLTTTLSSADIFIHDITPGTSKNSNSVNLNVTTNNVTGYVVSASTGDANNNSSDLIQTGITDKFSSIAASANLESLTSDDTWGYSTKVDTTSGNGTSEQTVHTEGTWSNLNGLATTSAPIYSTNSPLIADVNFRIAARASEDIEPGEYTNTINFFVVANPAPVTFSDAFAGAGKTKLNNYYKMQDMSPSICNAVIEGAQTQLIDTRDNSVYYIGKLADGNCWLLNNLALDLLDKNANTNITAANTNADATSLNALFNGGGGVLDQYATAGVANWTSDYSFSDPLTNISNKDIIPSDALSTAGVWKVGGYYNYCAASAGSYCYGNGHSSGSPSGNATSDICPSGWRMPTGGASGEYQALYDAYPSISGGDAQYTRVRKALNLPLSGSFYNGAPSNQGSGGSFWSSTYNSSSKMYYLGIGTSSIGPQNSYSRSNGFSVRCIARNGEEPGTFEYEFASAGKSKVTVGGNKYYQMQDMTTSICSAVTTPTAADYSDTPEVQLVDNRDNKIYWVAKLKDGHCWMTQNLDLDLETTPTNVAALTHANTDLGWGTDTATTSWTPTRATIPSTDIASDGTISNWTKDDYTPYSVDPGNWYWTDTWYTSSTNNYFAGNVGDPAKFQKNTPYTGNGEHGHVGNLYNWSATVASNDSSSYASQTYSDITNNPQNSICPAGWRLPTIYNSTTDSKNEFRYLLDKYSAYVTSGSEIDKTMTADPLYFVRGGYVSSSLSLLGSGYYGYYWSSTMASMWAAYGLNFYSRGIYPESNFSRYDGYSVRCVVR